MNLFIFFFVCFFLMKQLTQLCILFLPQKYLKIHTDKLGKLLKGLYNVTYVVYIETQSLIVHTHDICPHVIVSLKKMDLSIS